jgi:hypothetical protein
MQKIEENNQMIRDLVVKPKQLLTSKSKELKRLKDEKES